MLRPTCLFSEKSGGASGICCCCCMLGDKGERGDKEEDEEEEYGYSTLLVLLRLLLLPLPLPMRRALGERELGEGGLPIGLLQIELLIGK
eukprot:534431-Pelagomonas_calceolata.AAC.7